MPWSRVLKFIEGQELEVELEMESGQCYTVLGQFSCVYALSLHHAVFCGREDVGSRTWARLLTSCLFCFPVFHVHVSFEIRVFFSFISKFLSIFKNECG